MLFSCWLVWLAYWSGYVHWARANQLIRFKSAWPAISPENFLYAERLTAELAARDKGLKPKIKESAKKTEAANLVGLDPSEVEIAPSHAKHPKALPGRHPKTAKVSDIAEVVDSSWGVVSTKPIEAVMSDEAIKRKLANIEAQRQENIRAQSFSVNLKEAFEESMCKSQPYGLQFVWGLLSAAIFYFGGLVAVRWIRGS